MNSAKKEDEKLSEQLRAIQNLLLDLNKMLTEFIGSTAQWIEERRKEASKKEEKREIGFLFYGVLYGLLFGIFGNLLVSLFMEVYKIAVDVQNWFWTCVIALVSIAIVLVLGGRKMYKDAKKLTGLSL